MRKVKVKELRQYFEQVIKDLPTRQKTRDSAMYKKLWRQAKRIYNKSSKEWRKGQIPLMIFYKGNLA